MDDHNTKRHSGGGWIDGKLTNCRRCDKPITDKKRRTFCSDVCVHLHKIKTNGSYARAQVEKRDQGKCAKCGLDTARLDRIFQYLSAQVTPDFKRNWFRKMDQAAHDRWTEQGLFEGDDEALYQQRKQWSEWRKAHLDVFRRRHQNWLRVAIERYPWAFAEGHYGRAGEWFVKHLWEMDHIVPVVEGGGSCGLDNLRTLCVPCHKAATKELRGRLANNKKKTT